MPASKRRLLGASVLFLILFTLSTSSSCRGGGLGPAASLTIGTTTNEVNALIVIAQDRGYFARNDLEVTSKIYPSGVAAIDGVLSQEVDLAAGSEFALVREVLAGQDLRTIAAINRSSVEYLVGRIDRGIQTLADLRGKTIGVPLESRPEFALDRFLYWRGIDTSAVTLVDVSVQKSLEALVGGQVDAVAAWQPYVDQMRERMNDQVVVWSVQEDQPSYTLVLCEGEWAVENREVIVRFLKGLVQAERYVTDRPEEARAFIQEKWEYSADYMASVWPDHNYSVLLDQALVVAMEDQARWIIGKSLAAATQTPNVTKYIYVDGLEAVKPEAVNIIR